MSYLGPMSSAALWKSVSTAALATMTIKARKDNTSGETELALVDLVNKGLAVIPEMYGNSFTGNGSADDTVAVHKARDEAIASGRALYLPKKYATATGFSLHQGTAGAGNGLACPRRIWGEGISSGFKALAGCTGTLAQLKESSRTSLEFLDFDCAGIAATALDTTVTYGGGAPSMGLKLIGLRALNYLTSGWIGKNNNDLTVIEFSTSSSASGAVSYDIDAGAGILNISSCVLNGGPLKFGLQHLEISDACVIAGLWAAYNGFNQVAVRGPQLYPNPITGNVIDIATGKAIESIIIDGGLAEVASSAGAFFAGPGKILRSAKIIQTRLTNLGSGTAKLCADNLIGNGADIFHIHVDGSNTHGVDLANDPANGRLSHQLCQIDSVPLAPKIVTGQGAGWYSTVARDAFGLVYPALAALNVKTAWTTYATGTPITLPSTLTSGCLLVFAKGQSDQCPTAICILAKPSAGGTLVTSALASAPGTGSFAGQTITCDWPTGAAPRVTVATTNQTTASNLIYGVVALG